LIFDLSFSSFSPLSRLHASSSPLSSSLLLISSPSMKKKTEQASTIVVGSGGVMNQLSPVASMEERCRNVDDEAEKLNGGGGRKASWGRRTRTRQ
uniref:Uncharacterized protein n=1 Tax=Brassica oleracea var. oleracea TaxID=109376 RepID=A0A0D3BHB1_BRAOL